MRVGYSYNRERGWHSEGGKRREWVRGWGEDILEVYVREGHHTYYVLHYTEEHKLSYLLHSTRYGSLLLVT